MKLRPMLHAIGKYIYRIFKYESDVTNGIRQQASWSWQDKLVQAYFTKINKTHPSIL